MLQQELKSQEATVLETKRLFISACARAGIAPTNGDADLAALVGANRAHEPEDQWC